MSHCAGPLFINVNFFLTLNSAQKTARNSSVKTILGKTFACSPVNAFSVEPENWNLVKLGILHAPVIRRDSIPSLFQRSVLILREVHLGKYYCPYFFKMSLFLACVLQKSSL